MALFRRKKTEDTTALPEEVTSYYQAENRERTWMAWLLALVTLAVTALIIIGLFFGGRWAYRKIRNNNNTQTAVVTQNPAEAPQTEPRAENSTPDSDAPAPNSTSGNVNAPANPTANSSNPAPSTTSTPSPSASTPNQPATTDLPNTGPGDTLAIFLAVSVLAYLAHRKFYAKV